MALIFCDFSRQNLCTVTTICVTSQVTVCCTFLLIYVWIDLCCSALKWLSKGSDKGACFDECPVQPDLKLLILGSTGEKSCVSQWKANLCAVTSLPAKTTGPAPLTQTPYPCPCWQIACGEGLVRGSYSPGWVPHCSHKKVSEWGQNFMMVENGVFSQSLDLRSQVRPVVTQDTRPEGKRRRGISKNGNSVYTVKK